MTPAEADTVVRQLISGDPAAAAAILTEAGTSTEPLVLTTTVAAPKTWVRTTTALYGLQLDARPLRAPIGGMLEHIEYAGVHSGDASGIVPWAIVEDEMEGQR